MSVFINSNEFSSLSHFCVCNLYESECTKHVVFVRRASLAKSVKYLISKHELLSRYMYLRYFMSSINTNFYSISQSNVEFVPNSTIIYTHLLSDYWATVFHQTIGRQFPCIEETFTQRRRTHIQSGNFNDQLLQSFNNQTFAFRYTNSSTDTVTNSSSFNEKTMSFQCLIYIGVKACCWMERNLYYMLQSLHST